MNRLHRAKGWSKCYKCNNTRLELTMFNKYFPALLCSLALMIPGKLLIAHPHNWINVSTHFVLDDQNRLVMIKQSWEFDGIYSMITAADLKNSFENDFVNQEK